MRAHVLERGHVPKKPLDGEIGIHPRILRHKAKQTAEAHAHFEHVLTFRVVLCVGDTTTVGLEVIRDDVHERGLARAVWPKQSVDARRQRRGEVRQCFVGAVGFNNLE